MQEYYSCALKFHTSCFYQVKKRNSEESSTQWTTGTTEVQLPTTSYVNVKLLPYTKVAELISPEGEWKRDWIQQHFIKEDAKIISRIPLPRHTALDELCWHYDKLGNYLVKSGYQLALKENFPSAPSSSNPDPRQWNAIWKLDLPEKIRIFMWRAVKNLLPTAENLWKKEGGARPNMSKMQAGNGNSVHAMVECKAARKIRQLSHHAAEEITASCVVEAYRKFKRTEHQQLETSNMEKPKQWKPPPENWCKVNVDAVIDHQSQRAGLGVVIRNDKGDVVAAAIKPSSFNGDVPFAEAEGIEWGMQVAKKAGITAVILESDCQAAIDLANNRKGSKTEIFWVISEINKRRKEFQEVRFQHTLRSGNVNAHTLSKLAVKGSESVLWLGNIPAQVMCLFSLQ
ncbi:putative reverse transcriptase/RNA-dependent DNA polymerase [Citrus sinensis]|nr:putative reverse transcriptase/RNA-dependent DNA polymerase [Citrus sinensis]